MSVFKPTLATVIRAAIQEAAADLHVSIPAQVTRVDLAAGLVDAKPLVKDRVTIAGEEQVFSVPVVTNVPIVWPGAGGMRLTFPIAVGDTVLLVFTDRSLDVWLSSGGEVDPKDPRRHNLSDAVAFPGLRSLASPWSGADGSAVTIGAQGGPFQPAALGQDVRDELDAIWTALEGHTHGGVTAGTAFTGAASASTPPTSRTGKTKTVKSSTVKVSQ